MVVPKSNSNITRLPAINAYLVNKPVSSSTPIANSAKGSTMLKGTTSASGNNDFLKLPTIQLLKVCTLGKRTRPCPKKLMPMARRRSKKEIVFIQVSFAVLNYTKLGRRHWIDLYF